MLADTTEINFGCDRELFGAGRVGSNQGRGFFLHSGMIVGAREPRKSSAWPRRSSISGR